MIDSLAFLSAACLFLTWGIYPAVVGILASFRRSRVSAAANLPVVSVVIASREAPEAIRERVANVVRTRYPADLIEVIVASDREIAEAELAQTLEKAVRFRLVRPAGGGKALALNAGVAAANGEVVVFADTFQRFDEDTIPRLVQGLERPGVGAVSGSLELAPGTRPLITAYWRFERWLRRMEARLHSAVGVTGAVWAIRRALWEPLRPGLILDDVYTPMRVVLARQRVTFVCDATAHETRTPTPAQEYSRKVRTLTGVVQLCAWLPAVLVPIRNPIWVQFVCHKLLRMLTPYLLTVVVAWILAAATAAAGPTTLAAVAAVAVLALAWFLLTGRPWAVQIRHLAVEGILLQFAVLIAGVNGLRGNWKVWDA